MRKSKILKFIITIILVVIIILLIMYLYKFAKNKKVKYKGIDITNTNLEVKYEDKELTGYYPEYTGKIILNNSKIAIEGKGITNVENTITINEAGTYYITGELQDGNILIEAGKEDEIQLVLDNCTLTSHTTAPINCTKASKLIITATENSKNTITDSTIYKELTDIENSEPDATIFTKTDLVINGKGKLIVNANNSDAIASKDGLKIINSEIEINSKDDGIRGKDYVAINNASLNINSKGDGIKSTNDTDMTLGYIAIQGGIININAESDGIQAETILNISENPEINISAINKGLKSDTEITIETGKLNIQSTDDSINSNGVIIINNGTINLQTEDDAIRADNSVLINQANIDIQKCCEGIESSYIQINDGKISILSLDDAINVADKNNSETKENLNLIINGGIVTVNAEGDGLDSNGWIYINGGTIFVAGSESIENAALDSDSGCVISGGDIVLYSLDFMWENPSKTSTQNSLCFKIIGESGDKIVLKDSSGKEIKSFETEKAYGTILISNEKIKKGKTYTLYVNGVSVGTIKADSIVSKASLVNRRRKANE